ncbi:hypothetical protein [Lachnoclostridium sp. Marseille-P6806]|uniref:hypothetical protein n=1 Tax=Lachnoclostridium sp. Marseille-P6806 TaxID=2364793 RepID=UPI00102F34FC|nr:hypothetical protein [Lachnoclostridium sp. Marseille-P6806]
MEKKMFKTGKAGSVAACVLLLIMGTVFSVIAGGILLWIFRGTQITEADTYGEYVYADAVSITDSFVEDESGDQYVFCTVEDGGVYYDYIVCLPNEIYESDEMQEKIGLSGSEEDTSPLRLKGYMRETSEELDDVAAEIYSYYAGLEEDESAADYLGYVYLDYTGSGNNVAGTDSGTWVGLIALIVFAVLCFAEFVRTILRQRKKDKKIERAKQLYETDPDYASGVEQTKLPGAELYKKSGCYVTQDYVVNWKDGLEVFRIDGIRELYGYTKRNSSMAWAYLFGALGAALAGGNIRYYLVALTADGKAHEFAGLSVALKEHNRLVSTLLRKNMNMTLGRQNVPGNAPGQELDSLNLAKIKGFYGNDDVWSGRSVSD